MAVTVFTQELKFAMTTMLKNDARHTNREIAYLKKITALLNCIHLSDKSVCIFMFRPMEPSDFMIFTKD